MSYDLDGVNDGITSPTFAIGNLITTAIWWRADSQGGANAGYLAAYGTTGKFRFSFFGTATERRLRVYADHATTNGDWRMVNQYASLSGWNFAACARAALTGAQPTIWIGEGAVFTGPLTVGAGLTQIANAAGAAGGADGAFHVGKAFDATAQTFDGRIFRAALWQRLFVDSEVREIWLKGPGAQLRDLAVWWDFIRNSGTTIPDRSGNGRHGTVVGGAVYSAEETRLAQMAGVGA